MAVTIDIGDSRNIHPSNKKQFADRLANVALREVYGQEVAVYGPRYLRHQTEGATVRVHFSDVEGGLTTSDQESVREFAVAGGNRRFAAARVRIENDHIVAQSDKVPDPIAVRYAWSNDPRCNLVNTIGLPAAPFRTDDWPGKTHSAR
jgi:sialate O-acetylesterase